MYFGKGLGDLPIGFARPLAVTGELSYTIADRKLKPLQQARHGRRTVRHRHRAQFNNGNNNAWAGGFSVQYSLPYLQSQVKNVGLPSILGDLIPVVEVTWSSPAGSPSSAGHDVDRGAGRALPRPVG